MVKTKGQSEAALEEGQTTQWPKDTKEGQSEAVIEEGQITQWSKDKGLKDKQLSTKDYTEN